MRVVKQGFENETLPIIEVSCTGLNLPNKEVNPCGALLEVNGLDIKVGSYTDYSGEKDTYYFVICPVCGAKTEVYSKDIPLEIRNIIKLR